MASMPPIGPDPSSNVHTQTKPVTGSKKKKKNRKHRAGTSRIRLPTTRVRNSTHVSKMLEEDDEMNNDYQPSLQTLTRSVGVNASKATVRGLYK
eukprot:3841650-Ditylum_brightwellii.AAC.1